VAAGTEAVRLAKGIRTDVHLTRTEKLTSPARAAGLSPADFAFIRRRLSGVKRFYLILPKEERQNAFVAGGSRNFALFFLFPLEAVDDMRDADALIGLDGVDLRRWHIAGSRIERHNSVSVELLPPR
jgi:hypothetical protein